MKSIAYHEKRGEVHPPEDGVLHLGDLEEDPQKLLLSFHGGQKS